MLIFWSDKNIEKIILNVDEVAQSTLRCCGNYLVTHWLSDIDAMVTMVMVARKHVLTIHFYRKSFIYGDNSAVRRLGWVHNIIHIFNN